MFPLLVRILAVLTLSTDIAAAQAQARAPTLASDNLTTFSGAKRVVMEHFGVEFISTLKARGHGGGSSANIDAKLEGVSDVAMQVPTDRAYQVTMVALTQAGFEVVPAEELQAHAPYKELMSKVAHAHDSTYVVDDTEAYSRIFAPTGMKAVFKTGGGSRGTMGDRMESANSKYQGEFSDVAKSLGVYRVRFHYLASFGSTTSSKGFLSSFTGKARAAVEAGPPLMAKSTRVQIISHESARIFANNPLGGYASI